MSNNRANLDYVRYDEDNNVADPQPGFTSATSPQVGSGYSAREYRNFNADYVAREAGVGLTARTPQPYVRHGDNGQVIPTSRYVRMDEDNNPVEAQPGITTESVGVIYAPDGLVDGRTIYASAAQFSGGTPPFTYEAQFQRNNGSGWTGFTGWEFVGAASRVLSSNEVGFNLRANTRVTDRNTPEGEFVIAAGISTGPVVQAMAPNVKGDLTGTGSVGQTLTQTEGTIVGGIAPFQKAYEWIRSPVGADNFKRFGAADGLTYTVQADDVGFEIRGRTRYIDAFGFAKSVITDPGSITIT